jgi:hypothetical protein
MLSIAIQWYPTVCRLQQVGAETMPYYYYYYYYYYCHRPYHHHHHHHHQPQQQQQQKHRLLKPSIFMTVYMFSGVYLLSYSMGYIRKLVMDCGFPFSGM